MRHKSDFRCVWSGTEGGHVRVRGLVETGCDGCLATRTSLVLENVWLGNNKWNNHFSFIDRTEFGLKDICS